MSIRSRLGKLEKTATGVGGTWSPSFETNSSGEPISAEFPEIGMARTARLSTETAEEFRRRTHLDIVQCGKGNAEQVYKMLTTKTLEQCLAALKLMISEADPHLLEEFDT